MKTIADRIEFIKSFKQIVVILKGGERYKPDPLVQTLPSGATEWQAFDDSERYEIDFAPDGKNWDQFDTDQDAPYFGIWVNPTDLQTLRYAEGDWSFIQCENYEQYNREIDSMIEFYKQGRIATVIDNEARTATTLVQDRTKFLIEPVPQPVTLADVTGYDPEIDNSGYGPAYPAGH